MAGMTLTEFLLARIAEDESAARAAIPEGAYPHFGETAAEECVEMAKSEGCAAEGYRHLRRWLPDRVLADCEAKRKVVELHSENDTTPSRYELECWNCREDYPCTTLRLLAPVYASHPDYREAWRIRDDGRDMP